MDYSKFRLRSFTKLPTHYILRCGSYNELPLKYCEANLTDEDFIFYFYDICAIPWSRNPPKNTKCTILRIDSKQTPPGFAKLMADRNNMEDNPTYLRRPHFLRNIKTGGPSWPSQARLTPEFRKLKEHHVTTQDYVYAVYCPYWPVEAEEWRNRKRFHGWPNEKLIARITRGGCHFVSKLRTWSSSDDTEWRFSFSKAELILTHSWTPDQKYVYHAIRTLKRRISESCGGDGSKGFQTYYFKTLMFWACEEFPPEFWNQESLKKRLNTLLLRFCRCLNEKFCPSYFIPDCNIMSHLKNEESFHKELQTVHKIMRSQITIDVGKFDSGMLGNPLEYDYLYSKFHLFPLNKILNGRIAQYLSECEWFLQEMKNLHAAIEAHLRLMSVDSVTERQTSKDYVICLENFNCASLKRGEFESYICVNADMSFHEDWIRVFVRKLLRNSIPIYSRKNPGDKPQNMTFFQSYPSLLHGVTAAYRANFYFTAMKSYKESLNECEKCLEVLNRTIGFVRRSPSELTSHISLLICNSLSQIFDVHLQVILGFVTLHRNISFSNSPSTATSHEVCLKIRVWEFLKYIHIQCQQKLSSISMLSDRITYSSSVFARLYMSKLVDVDRFSAAIIVAALRQSGVHMTCLPGSLIPGEFIHERRS